MAHNIKRGLETATEFDSVIQWTVELLNSEGPNRLRELIVDLCELGYGPINTETKRKIGRRVNEHFGRVRVSPVLGARNGRLWIKLLPREGDTVFQQNVLALVDLARLGLLARIHRCSRPGCDRWFVCKRERSPYTLEKPHSDNCRIALHRQKPEVKKKRAAYMRDRYQKEVAESLKLKKRGLK